MRQQQGYLHSNRAYWASDHNTRAHEYRNNDYVYTLCCPPSTALDPPYGWMDARRASNGVNRVLFTPYLHPNRFIRLYWNKSLHPTRTLGYVLNTVRLPRLNPSPSFPRSTSMTRATQSSILPVLRLVSFLFPGCIEPRSLHTAPRAPDWYR